MTVAAPSRDVLVTIGAPAASAAAACVEAGIAGNPALEAEGWQRRYLADEPRAREALELYGSMGFEVRAEKLDAEDFAEQCGDCSPTVCRSYVMIYTRKPAAS